MLVVFMASGCINDKCNNTVCSNNGVCVQAKCACPGGYEGLQCEQTWGDKYNGDWKADDMYLRDTTRSHVYYNLQVSDVSTDSFTVYGLLDTLKPIKCRRTNLYTFNISSQILDSSVTINSGKCVIDTANRNTVTGSYNFRYRNGNLDTIITINTRWTR
ncbi:MAG: hypothetical protein EOP51_14895 [Sphingobacteriales bacterium]|nr:MAG: hypothetical protein EOP51_14895 [Sphingobacteriales bacterium]